MRDSIEPVVASHPEEEIDRLRAQLRALARANANAAELMAELREARELA